MVAGHQDNPPQPGAAQLAQGAGGIGANRVSDGQRTSQHAVDRDEHRGEALQGAASAQPAGPGWQRLALRGPGRSADRDATVTDPAAYPPPGLLLHTGREDQGEMALGGRPHDRAGQHMLGDLVERGGQTQQLVAVAGVRLDLGHLRRPRGQGASLVEQQHPPGGQAFQRPAALDHDPPAGGPRDAGDDRHRGGQNQRAGRRHHQHRQGSHGLPRHQPGDAGHGQREGHKGERVAVGQPHERCLGRLGLLDQPQDAGIGAGRGRGGRAQVEGDPALTTPLRTWSPSRRSTGSASPVRADSSRTAEGPEPARRRARPHPA